MPVASGVLENQRVPGFLALQPVHGSAKIIWNIIASLREGSKNVRHNLRYYGRQLIQPVEKIKQLCRENIEPAGVHSIVDFGSGTLFWSEWLAAEYQCDVYAVDIQYPEQKSADSRFIYYRDIEECLAQKERFSMLWMCDVLHHLDPELMERIKPEIFRKFDIIVLKDIDARRKFKNFANRMHDLVINGQLVRDVYPPEIVAELEANGYQVQEFAIPRLWYAHFLLIAQRQK